MALLVAAAARADTLPSADLTVSGTIEPGACTMTTGGEIDYGNITLNTDTTADTKLDRQNLTKALTVSCSYPVRISLSFSDNRSDSEGGNTQRTNTAEGWVFKYSTAGEGLGFDSGGNKIGGYAFTIGEFLADGATSNVAVAPGGKVERWKGGIG